MKRFLQLSAALLCLALIPCAWMVAVEAASTLRQAGLAAEALATVPQMAGERLAALQSSVDGLPEKVLPPVLAVVDARTGEALRVVKDSVAVADGRLASVQQQVDRTSKDFLLVADGVRADVRPVLANSAALIADTQASLDDSYWDGKALLESATVATTQAAQTMEYVRQIAPQFLAASQRTNEQLAGVATDFHSMTTSADERFFHPKPRTWKQKLAGGFEAAGWIGLAVVKATK